MSTAEVVLPSSNRQINISQATAIEQSRAIAEVQAMVVVAQQCKRDVTAALSEIRASCAQPALANKAFFRYARGGSNITGPSIHLARELARCWGNITYGITELSRDNHNGTSEMSAWAWDVQTNTRNSNTFIAPHKRDTKAGAKDITDLRDVYENNANLGARRVREAIFAVMPEWVVEDAKERCLATVANPGDGKTTAQRAADIVKAFADMGVKQTQLEQKLGSKVSEWSDHDVAALKVIGGSLRRGETTIADEFTTAAAQQRVTAAEIKQQTPPATEPKLAKGQLIAIHKAFTELGMGGEDEDVRAGRLEYIAGLGINVTSTKDLTVSQAATVLDALDERVAAVDAQ